MLYVAVTRAKRALQLTPTLMRVLHYAGVSIFQFHLVCDFGFTSVGCTIMM